MRKFLSIILLLSVASLWAQDDIIFLNNGDKYRGAIFKIDNQGNVAIRLKDGNTRFVFKEKIDSISRCSGQAPEVEIVNAQNEAVNQQVITIESEIKDTPQNSNEPTHKATMKVYKRDLTESKSKPKLLKTIKGTFTKAQINDSINYYIGLSNDGVVYQCVVKGI